MRSYVHIELYTIWSYVPRCPLAGINQWASTLLNGDVDHQREKASFEKGAEGRACNSLLLRSYSSSCGSWRVSPPGEARPVPSGLVLGRGRGGDREQGSQQVGYAGPLTRAVTGARGSGANAGLV